MGTNYYLHKNACSHCGRSDEVLHIGKSSAGWCFSLHVMPDEGINNLPDWEALFKLHPIVDEYGKKVPEGAMLSIIKARKNDSLRHPVGYHCLGPGEGPWDLIRGEFS